MGSCPTPFRNQLKWKQTFCQIEWSGKELSIYNCLSGRAMQCCQNHLKEIQIWHFKTRVNMQEIYHGRLGASKGAGWFRTLYYFLWKWDNHTYLVLYLVSLLIFHMPDYSCLKLRENKVLFCFLINLLLNLFWKNSLVLPCLFMKFPLAFLYLYDINDSFILPRYIVSL